MKKEMKLYTQKNSLELEKHLQKTVQQLVKLETCMAIFRRLATGLVAPPKNTDGNGCTSEGTATANGDFAGNSRCCWFFRSSTVGASCAFSFWFSVRRDVDEGRGGAHRDNPQPPSGSKSREGAVVRAGHPCCPGAGIEAKWVSSRARS